MTDSSGTTSSLEIIKTGKPRLQDEPRICASCGGSGRLVEKFGDSWLHLNMSECRTDTE